MTPSEQETMRHAELTEEIMEGIGRDNIGQQPALIRDAVIAAAHAGIRARDMARKCLEAYEPENDASVLEQIAAYYPMRERLEGYETSHSVSPTSEGREVEFAPDPANPDYTVILEDDGSAPASQGVEDKRYGANPDCPVHHGDSGCGNIAACTCPPTEAVSRCGEGEAAISPSDSLVILAGIKQFGLAPDRSDVRDLEASIKRLLSRLQTTERQLEEAKGEAIDNYDSWQYAEKVLSARQEKLEAAEAGANRREAFWQKHYDARNRELSATQENLEAAERELELLKADPIHKWIEEANAKLQSAEASLAASEREKAQCEGELALCKLWRKEETEELKAMLATSEREKEELRGVIKAAWDLIAKLERDYCIDFTMYDGREVEVWCEKSRALLTEDIARHALNPTRHAEQEGKTG